MPLHPRPPEPTPPHAAHHPAPGAAPRPVPIWQVVLGLVAAPIGLALAWALGTCGCTGFIVAAAGGSGDGGGGSGGSGGAGVLANGVSVLILLALCTASGGLLARWVVRARRAATPPDDLPAFYRHVGWAWALFTALHLALTVAYAVAIGALVIHTIAELFA